MQVRTSQYEASHNRKPRGTGYWWFHLVWNDGATSPVQFLGTYTEAKAKALKAAKDATAASRARAYDAVGKLNRVVEVVVLP